MAESGSLWICWSYPLDIQVEFGGLFRGNNLVEVSVLRLGLEQIIPEIFPGSVGTKHLDHFVLLRPKAIKGSLELVIMLLSMLEHVILGTLAISFSLEPSTAWWIGACCAWPGGSASLLEAGRKQHCTFLRALGNL
jgi:hypothetical protein